jgi:hypothetical protein
MERRALQIMILLAGIVPVYGGAVGVLRGSRAFGDWSGVAGDSQTRYLSGLLLGLGLVFWACVPTIEKRGTIIRALAFLVIVGGLARLGGILFAGDSGRLDWALGMELAVTPALVLWQARIAARCSAPPFSPLSAGLDKHALP